MKCLSKSCLPIDVSIVFLRHRKNHCCWPEEKCQSCRVMLRATAATAAGRAASLATPGLIGKTFANGTHRWAELGTMAVASGERGEVGRRREGGRKGG